MSHEVTGPAALGGVFGGGSGKWAAERFMANMKAGKGLTTDALRTLDTLRKDEWVFFDDTLIEEVSLRLRAVADLVERGLTRTIPNGMAKTMLEYEKTGDMFPAQLSMDGVTRTENDRLEFELHGLPLPIAHKDFWIHLRTLLASRERGEGLDVTQVRTCGRLIAELIESVLIQGTAKKYGGQSIYGYMTHPDRNTLSFGTNGAWSAAAKTGENILTDVQSLIAAAHADRKYGPYALYYPTDASVKMLGDFKANSDKSIRSRVAEVDDIVVARSLDQLPTANVLLVQLTSDVVQLVEGEPLQTVQWDVEGGMVVNFKCLTIQVPLIRSDVSERSGIVHMS